MKITLTADSVNVDPTTLANNPTTTSVNGPGELPCTTGCTISGPPAPPGNDTFVITMYDMEKGAGNALDTTPGGGFMVLTIAAGSTPAPTITLYGIPNQFSLSPKPSGTADTATTTTFGPAGNASLNVADADGETVLTATPGTCTVAGPFSTYATIAAAGVTGASGSTQFTLTAATVMGQTGAQPGICPVNVGDGLTLNSSDATATFETSYTSSSINPQARARAKCP